MAKKLDIRRLDEAKTETRVVARESGSGPWKLRANTCVLGAGIGGVSAAIESARLGHSVVLVDGLPSLGGQAVNGIVGTFCGLFANGPDPSQHYQFTHGIADEILRELDSQGAIHYRRGQWTTVLYDEVALGRWVENAVAREDNITPLLGAILQAVDTDGRRVTGLHFATRFGDVHIEADYFVDASGDAALTYLAGLPCRTPAQGNVFGSQMVVIEGVDIDRSPDRTTIADRLKAVGADYGLLRREGFAFSFPGRGTALVNMTHVETPLHPTEIVSRGLEGKSQADKAIQFLQKEFPDAFGRASVRSYGQLGIRQTRWIVGAKQLTLEEVLAGEQFDDAVARTAWAIELHDKQDSHIFHTFGEGHVHYVPFRSMTPPDADNLVAVGRCVDGDVAALSSVRVMGPCIAMGAAAANAIDLADGASLHSVDAAQLRARVHDNVDRRD
ncbi:FAD-dependent oxidoreductase [Qaidamihabitans albus]|uniref:FAD-dependent oxidoreductase n=1 Tax=Qaidamihabitans albus TaxID=2795733 RepID=UPI001F3523F4|nr:FAD-dependent oxidoreductase [Qaidamihabitans albus]